MRPNKPFLYISLFCVIGLFLYGIFKLFGLTFAIGEMYPPYSSLRTDPLGGKALYESLALLKPLEVSRNYDEVFRKLPAGQHSTLIILGLSGNDLENTPKKIAEIFDRFMQEGGRIVIAFAPDWGYQYLNKKAAEEEQKDRQKRKEEKEEKKPCPEKQAEECDEQDRFFLSLAEHWGLEVKTDQHFDPAEQQVASRQEAGPLPATVGWHTSFYFDRINKPWKVIYAVHRKAVIIEKPYGQGSLVLAGDSYLFSNEAMRSERKPELLAWFIGPHQKIIFDEAHFGIVKQEGVATLIRRFGMQWFLVGFLLIAVLYIWKQMMPLVPPKKREGENANADTTLGFDDTQGLVSLLQRSIGTKGILNACFEEWSKSSGSGRIKESQKSAEIKRVVLETVSQKRDPIQGYKTICKILSQRRSV